MFFLGVGNMRVFKGWSSPLTSLGSGMVILLTFLIIGLEDSRLYSPLDAMGEASNEVIIGYLCQ